jgi:drug/metabolite transporter (DMT)-like permease
MKQLKIGAWWLIFLSILSSVAGQTAIKLGVSQPGATKATSNLLSLVLLIFQSPLLLLGFALYATGALAWIAVLSRFHLSMVYPFLALNIVLVALVSAFFLGEAIPMLRWAGILVVCAGILLVARSTR